MALLANPGGECSEEGDAWLACRTAGALNSLPIMAKGAAFDPESVEVTIAAWFGAGALTTQHSPFALRPPFHALSCFMQHGCGDDVTAPKHNATGISTVANTAAATIRFAISRRIHAY